MPGNLTTVFQWVRFSAISFLVIFRALAKWDSQSSLGIYIQLLFQPLLQPGSSRSPLATTRITIELTIICIPHVLFHPKIRPRTLRTHLDSARIIPPKKASTIHYPIISSVFVLVLTSLHPANWAMTSLAVTSRAEATIVCFFTFWNAQIRLIALLHAAEDSVVSGLLTARIQNRPLPVSFPSWRHYEIDMPLLP